MKLAAKTDLEVPAAAVFAALIDTPTWEREAIRNGVEVERPAGTPDSGVGAEWRIRGHFRGKARKVTVRIAEMTPGQRLASTPIGRPTALTVQNVPPGVYYVRLRATNEVGTSQTSNEVRVVVP